MPWKKQFLEMLFPLDRRKLNIEGAFLLKYTNLPTSIFKYRSINENSLKNLRDGTIWLADPTKLNDPYDCAHSVDLSKMASDTFRKMPEALIKKIPKEKIQLGLLDALKNSKDPLETLMNAMLSEEPLEKRTQMKAALVDVLNTMHEEMAYSNSEHIKSSFKLCSFSERLDSTLMWAHYANYHKGFCVEYDLKSIRPDDYRSRFLYPIIYSKVMFDATDHVAQGVDSEFFNNLHLNMAALIKSTDWSYEVEWRLLFANGLVTKEEAYHMPKPKAVYLGSHISVDEQKLVLDICQKIDVKTMKMKHSVKEFSMYPCSIGDADRKFFTHSSP